MSSLLISLFSLLKHYMYITDHGEQPNSRTTSSVTGLLRLYCKPLYRTGDTSTVRADAC